MTEKEEYTGTENNNAIHHVTQTLQDSESLLDQEKMSDLKDRFSYKSFNELMDKSQKQEERQARQDQLIKELIEQVKRQEVYINNLTKKSK